MALRYAALHRRAALSLLSCVARHSSGSSVRTTFNPTQTRGLVLRAVSSSSSIESGNMRKKVIKKERLKKKQRAKEEIDTEAAAITAEKKKKKKRKKGEIQATTEDATAATKMSKEIEISTRFLLEKAPYSNTALDKYLREHLKQMNTHNVATLLHGLTKKNKSLPTYLADLLLDRLIERQDADLLLGGLEERADRVILTKLFQGLRCIGDKSLDSSDRMLRILLHHVRGNGFFDSVAISQFIYGTVKFHLFICSSVHLFICSSVICKLLK